MFHVKWLHWRGWADCCAVIIPQWRLFQMHTVITFFFFKDFIFFLFLPKAPQYIVVYSSLWVLLVHTVITFWSYLAPTIGRAQWQDGMTLFSPENKETKTSEFSYLGKSFLAHRTITPKLKAVNVPSKRVSHPYSQSWFQVTLKEFMWKGDPSPPITKYLQ